MSGPRARPVLARDVTDDAWPCHRASERTVASPAAIGYFPHAGPYGRLAGDACCRSSVVEHSLGNGKIHFANMMNSLGFCQARSERGNVGGNELWRSRLECG